MTITVLHNCRLMGNIILVMSSQGILPLIVIEFIIALSSVVIPCRVFDILILTLFILSQNNINQLSFIQ